MCMRGKDLQLGFRTDPFIVEQIGSLCNADVVGYVKLQRQTRWQEENKRC